MTFSPEDAVYEAESLEGTLQMVIDRRRRTVLILNEVATVLQTTKSNVRTAKLSGCVGSVAGSIACCVGTFLLVGAAATPVGLTGIAVGVAGTVVGAGASIAEGAIGNTRYKLLRAALEEDGAALNALVEFFQRNSHFKTVGQSEAVVELIQRIEKATEDGEAKQMQPASTQSAPRKTFWQRVGVGAWGEKKGAEENGDQTLPEVQCMKTGPEGLETIGGPSSVASAGNAAFGAAAGATKASNLTKAGGHLGTVGMVPLQVFSGALSAIMLPWEIYNLTVASIDLHKDSPPEAAQKIRMLSERLERELGDFESVQYSLWLSGRSRYLQES
mmetsp:Transcript_2188/g.5054  ORF Transcript_2188/g.5054 Transcript_2188/m.5054 type:complete len:330 (+) Transcript_2188:201-1190(+)